MTSGVRLLLHQKADPPPEELQNIFRENGEKKIKKQQKIKKSR